MNQRLGRGLDFLLRSKDEGTELPAEPTAASDEKPLELDPNRIQANPWQPRTEFDEEGLEELTNSIREHGLVQPILVRRVGNEYQLIAGERRLLASRRAALPRIPVVVREVDDQQMLTLAIIENVQRRDLNPVERARAYQRLSKEQGLSHQQVADLCGVGRSTVSNVIRMLDLEEHQLDAVAEGSISESHARTLLAEKDSVRREALFRDMVTGEVSVRRAEDEVAKGRPPAGKSKKKGRRSGEAKVLERNLKEAVGLPVRIQESGTAGKVVIRYRDLAEFDRLYRHMTGKNPDL